MNWRRVADRRRMRRRGIEDVEGAAPFMAPLLKKPSYRQPPSKTEQRKQAAAAFMAWRGRHGAK
jgi:hypothetical protein